MKTFLIIILLVIFSSCSNNEQQSYTEKMLKTINVNEWIEKLDRKDVTVIDLRTPPEISQGKVKDAIEIDFYSNNFQEQLNKLNKEKIYLIYCRSGARSGNALDMMNSLGFESVYDLSGGVIALDQTGFELN